MIYLTVPLSMTFTDPYHSSEMTSLFAAEHVRDGMRYGHSAYTKLLTHVRLTSVVPNDLQ